MFSDKTKVIVTERSMEPALPFFPALRKTRSAQIRIEPNPEETERLNHSRA